MKLHKTMLVLTLILSAPLTLSACSSADSADNKASSTQEQNITDEQKQQVEPFVQDFYKKVAESKLTKPNEEQKAAYLKLRETKGTSVEEISSSIDEKLTGQEKTLLLDYISAENKAGNLIDTAGLSDNEKIMLNMIITRPTKLSSDDISKLKVDTSKVQFESGSAVVTSEARTYEGKAAKNSLPLELKLVDSAWKVDGKKFLSTYISKITPQKTDSEDTESATAESSSTPNNG